VRERRRRRRRINLWVRLKWWWEELENYHLSISSIYYTFNKWMAEKHSIITRNWRDVCYKFSFKPTKLFQLIIKHKLKFKFKAEHKKDNRNVQIALLIPTTSWENFKFFSQAILTDKRRRQRHSNEWIHSRSFRDLLSR
jgi:hypothetical protein